MDNLKIENLLNLALVTPEEERKKSLNLNVGYDIEQETWEVIVKYNGSLDRLELSGITVEELIAGYAILNVPENLVDSLANLEEIEYVEKPKRLFFASLEGRRSSCILPVTIRPPYLSGEGTIVAILDSGIDYTNMDFRNPDGSSRILYLWDQTIAPHIQRGWSSPEGFALGVEFTKSQIDEALESQVPQTIVPSFDASGHGAAVAGIAAGNGSSSSDNYAGVAPQANLIVVKLGFATENSFPRTTELMRGLYYVLRKAQEESMSIVINLSFGNTYGAHDGNSLLERYVDNITEIGRTVVCVGSGNEGASAGHVAGVTGPAGSVIELAVGTYETSLNVQLWKNYADRYRVILRSPGGQEEEVPMERLGNLSVIMENTQVLIYVGSPRPYSVSQEIYFDMIPVDTYLTSGIWTFEIIPIRVVTGEYYFYLPSEAARNSSTRFYAPTPEVTLTIPSTSRKVITVGAYNSIYNSYADFSGRGYRYGRESGAVGEGNVKPDLVAPGVDIVAPDARGGYTTVTGTSFAVPFVTGSTALLMEWGIVQQNDPFLWGEKVKAYLIRGAKSLPGITEYPNAQVGWGALCLVDSIPD